jgi:hypothetical protein
MGAETCSRAFPDDSGHGAGARAWAATEMHARAVVPSEASARLRIPRLSQRNRQAPSTRTLHCASVLTPEAKTKAELALRELRRLARLVQAGLLALDLPRIARQIAVPLEQHTEVRVDLDERAGDAVAHCAGLA